MENELFQLIKLCPLWGARWHFPQEKEITDSLIPLRIIVDLQDLAQPHSYWFALYPPKAIANFI